MTGKILVTGATGNVGAEVVKVLLAKGADIRVGVREIASAQKIFGAEVEVVAFDFLNPATYSQTFAGVERMFLVRPPALANVKTEIAPALIAAKAAGVQQIVFLSIQGVENNRLVPHYKIEQTILELGMAYTFLRVGFFMQNLSTTHRAEIRDDGEIVVPVGKAKTSFIDIRDIAAVAGLALTEQGHENKAYTLTGSQALDYYEVARILTAALDHPVIYTNPSAGAFFYRQLAAGSKLGYALVVTGLYTITRFGNAKEVTTEVQQVLGKTPITFETFVQDYKACWMQGV